MAVALAGRRRQSTLLMAIGLFLASFGLYAALQQACFHLHDGWAFAVAWERGDYAVSHHYLYPLLGLALVHLGGSVGLSVFTVGGLYSAGGAALAVALFFAGLRRIGTSSSGALLAALLAASSPPLVFYASVLEPHAPFLGAAGLAFFAVASLVRRPTIGGAVLAGAAIVLARGMHGVGLLLVPQLLLWFVWSAWWRARRIGCWRALLLAGVAAGAVVLGSFALARLVVALGGAIPRSSSLQTLLASNGIVTNSLVYGAVAWREWVVPYLPLSALGLAALAARRLRLEATILLAVLLPYVALATIILHDIFDRGSYFLALLFPAAPLALRVLGRSWSLVAVLVSLALGVHAVRSHERQRGVDLDYARHAFTAAGQTPARFLVWEDREVDSILLARGGAHYEPIFLRNLVLVQPAVQQQALPHYPSILGSGQLILSELAERGLADPAGSPSGPILLDFLRQAYEMRPVESGTFRGTVLVRRQGD